MTEPVTSVAVTAAQLALQIVGLLGMVVRGVGT